MYAINAGPGFCSIFQYCLRTLIKQAVEAIHFISRISNIRLYNALYVLNLTFRVFNIINHIIAHISLILML
jgi:hypothetical protein